MLTDAKPEGFTPQLKALENLVQASVKCHPAVMTSFSTKEHLQSLVERLRSISFRLTKELEVEELILYLKVKRKIEMYHLKYHIAYTPKSARQ